MMGSSARTFSEVAALGSVEEPLEASSELSPSPGSKRVAWRGGRKMADR